MTNPAAGNRLHDSPTARVDRRFASDSERLTLPLALPSRRYTSDGTHYLGTI
jgi:hypothetical protein